MISIVIPYHNEGQEFLSKTLDSLFETIDIQDFEVIVVDDGSDVPIEDGRVRIIRHEKNLGVGAAFDSGVSEANGDYLFLMGSDIRFDYNRWGSRMIKEIDSHPDSLICTSVVSLYVDKPEITFEYSRRLYKYNGAVILFLHGHSDTPDQPDNFHSILNARWLPREYIKLIPPEFDEGDPFAEFLKDQYNINFSRAEAYEVPCILGAFYGTTKKWYQYIDGFWGHRQWGTLEPYISLKSWLFGGSCYTCHIETGHLFKSDGTHKTAFENIAYNKLLVSWLLFGDDDRERLINWLPNHDYILKAKELIEENKEAILKKSEEYKNKTVFTVRELVQKFNMKF